MVKGVSGNANYNRHVSRRCPGAQMLSRQAGQYPARAAPFLALATASIRDPALGQVLP